MAQLIIWNSIDEPNSISRPGGAYAVAYWAQIHGYSTKVIDFGYQLKTKDLVEITKKHVDKDTIAIGVSTTLWKTRNSIPITPTDWLEPQWVIDARSELTHLNVKWLMGGAQSHLKFPKYFEWILIHNEGEDPLLKFLDEESKNKNNRKNFDITNCTQYYLEGNTIRSNEFLSLELSRGCQFKCKFCRYPFIGKTAGTYIRNEHAIEEAMLFNYEKFGTTNYIFPDDTVNETPEKIETIANLAQRLPFKLNWIGFTRLDLMSVNPSMIDLLKASGLKTTFIGVESFHPESSKIIGKGWNGKYGKDFIIKLQETWGPDINLYLGFIAGLNDETEDDLWETHEWCKNNNVAQWQFLPLHITSHDFQYKSEFDRNHQMYGYRFMPTESHPDYWESDTWTYETAKKVVRKLNEDIHRHARPASWAVGYMAALDYDINDLMRTKIVDLDWNDIDKRKNAFIDNYVKDQLK